MEKITGSIVLFKNNRIQLLDAIDSFLETDLKVKLFLVDNSPTDDLKNIKINPQVEYLFNPSNPGFGSSHNTAIQKAIDLGSDYHFIVNPDVYFDEEIISPMINYIQQNKDVGMMMPQILNTDGTVQNLPKLLPSPLSILLRKIKLPKWYYEKFINKYELRFVNKNKTFNSPILSGCFTLLNLKAIKEIGMYDDSFFMYFEDWDLSRRIHEKYKTIYFPEVSVYHEYDSGANKSSKLFKIFIKSLIIYFNKWGWLLDKDRKKINIETLSQFK